MLIQIILIAIIAVIILRLAMKMKAKEISQTQFIGWLLIWLGAGVIILVPQITVNLASFVGVGRGADLVVYLSIIALFYIIFRLVLRLEKIEKNITKLVRAEALKDYDESK